MIPKCYLFIPFLPLVSFVFNMLFGKRVLKDKAHLVPIVAVSGSLFFSFVVLIYVLFGNLVNEDLYTWVKSGDFKVSIGFLIDELTAVMLIVVSTVSLLVHVYSIGYMHGDERYSRFFAYLSLFTFSMLMLVMSNNFLQLYFGWEAVGLSSYFLIGFWYEKKSASDAAKKAFIVNRFGDFGFGLGVILLFITFGTLHYVPIFSDVELIKGQVFSFLGMDMDVATLIALLLFCGAVGKSAQLPLHTWLPDAMEGPTPVSALIHAATMVTAGVFLVARANPIFSLSPTALTVVALTGGITAIFAATIALVQNDIKRIIAYSTISQLGYMFVACGVGAYASGIFHLYTHAFFKALLFLCAGSVMHAMSGETNIQKMGGLKEHMPYTYWTMLIASLSIAGVPGFAGFFSKDDILWRAFASGTFTGKFVWFLCTVGAMLTAFYTFRIIFLTFHGTFRGTKEEKKHLHESPQNMTMPLVVLAGGSVLAGYVGIPVILGGNEWFSEFLSPVVGYAEGHGGHLAEFIVMLLSVIVAGFGIYGAYYIYLKRIDIANSAKETFKPIYNILYGKYYVDELYEYMVQRTILRFTKYVIEKVIDSWIIEGIVNGVPAAIGWLSMKVRRVQTGVVGHYSLAMALGFFVLTIMIVFKIWN
ncbi:MAG: NADH-quinone oxidoreductase subunit L [Candidatus Magnetoovum sp. WYHC-5]|nr:NADH-quinone oxidoreductase subunit L [Candidatus Magnetoovum sp. WYHC-5]